MNRKERIRIIIGILINAIILGLAIFCLCYFINHLLKGDKDIKFRYFTNISNLYVGIIAIPNIVLLTLSLFRNRIVFPKVLSILKFVGVSMISLTFFTVLLAIAPLTSYQLMYRDVKFITHLVIPVLSIVSYLFFEEKNIFEWKYSFTGFVPPIIYSIIYSIAVVFTKIWPDIYQVNKDGLWYVFMLIVDVFGFALAEGLYFTKKALSKKKILNK